MVLGILDGLKNKITQAAILNGIESNSLYHYNLFLLPDGKRKAKTVEYLFKDGKYSFISRDKKLVKFLEDNLNFSTSAERVVEVEMYSDYVTSLVVDGKPVSIHKIKSVGDVKSLAELFITRVDIEKEVHIKPKEGLMHLLEPVHPFLKNRPHTFRALWGL